jgi:hypothetical protein
MTTRWFGLALATGAFCVLSVGLLGSMAFVTGAPMLFPSLGPTAYLLALRPEAPSASPRNTVVGHGIGVLCGVLALLVCGLWGAPGSLAPGEMTLLRVFAAALALGGTGFVMVLADRSHPPAGATTLIVALGLMPGSSALVALMASVVGLVLLGRVFGMVAGVRPSLGA